MAADGLEQEALAAAVLPHNEAEGGTALCDDIHIVKQRIDLQFSAHSNVGQSDAWHNAAFQGVDNGGGDSLGDFHGAIIPFKSSA